MQPHLLWYTDDPSVYGVGQCNHANMCGAVRAGFRVTCVQSRGSNVLVAQREKLGIRHVWLEYDTRKDILRMLEDARDAKRIFKDQKPDLIVFGNSLPISNMAAMRIAAAEKIPFVVVEGYAAAPIAEKYRDRLDELARHYAVARDVIAVSHENLELLRAHFRLPADKGRVIYNGRPAGFFTPPDPEARARLRGELKLSEDAVLCFTAARLHGVKGFQYQVKAFARLMTRPVWARLHFAWAGTGPSEADLRAVIHQMKLGGHVHLLGERNDVPQWLDAADVFVLPSVYEGMPLAVMEAMAKGLPVVASAVSGIPEELGETGQLLPSPQTNPDATVVALAQTLEAWAADAGLRRRLGEAGRRRACEMFTEERMLRQTLAVLQAQLPAALRKDLALPAGPAESPAAVEPRARAAAPAKAAVPPASKIVVDGVFFQTGKRGVGRVWRELLEEWRGSEFAERLVFLDRGKTAPRVKGIHYREIAPYDRENPSRDRALLQHACDEEQAAVFISTYFTAPLTTPTLSMVHDMVPEALGLDLSLPEWREKQFCLRQADAFLVVSHNTARDVVRFCPWVPLHAVTVAYNGIQAPFTPASGGEEEAFRKKYRLAKPYFLLVGERKKYKNARLFFEAFASLKDKRAIDVVCVSRDAALEREFQPYAAGSRVHMLPLDDAELRLAYAGALALAYPSLYEGFGLCVLEAMACGCPVITCRNSSLPEVAGDAALYVAEDDVAQMAGALDEVRQPRTRAALIARGLERAQKFSWKEMAEALPRAAGALAERSAAETVLDAKFAAKAAELAAARSAAPTAPAFRQRLRELRRDLAHFWLHAREARVPEHYAGSAGAVLRLLLENGAAHVPLDEPEAAFVEALHIGLNLAYDTPRATAHLLALLPYQPPHQMALQFKRIPLPGWLLRDAIRWFSAPPLFFRFPGEPALFARHLERWLTHFSGVALAQPETPLAKELAAALTESLDLAPLKLVAAPASRGQSEGAHARTCALRAKLLEVALKGGLCEPAHIFAPRPVDRKTIRVGVLHTQFRPGAATYALLPLFEHLNGGPFEVRLYALAKGEELLEEQCRKRVQHFAILPEATAEQARLIRGDELDVLLIGGEGGAAAERFGLLAAQRLARVQIAAPASADELACHLSDHHFSGAALECSQDRAAQTLALEGSGLCFSWPPERAIEKPLTREQLNVPADAPLYLSCAPAAEITAELMEAWARILAEVPEAVLLLALVESGPLDSPRLRWQAEIWDGILNKYGVHEDSLILMDAPEAHAETLAILNMADVCVEPFPVSNPFLVACGMEAQVPVVALQCHSRRGRRGATLLREAGLAEYVAQSEAEYIRLATQLGRDTSLRQHARETFKTKFTQGPPWREGPRYGRCLGEKLTQLVRPQALAPDPLHASPGV